MGTHFKIITTCWNAEKWIECCIRSVLEQSYKDFQMIVVDDCSTDSTPDILKRHSCDKLKVIRTECHLKTKLRNELFAIEASKAKDEDIIILLDGDDMLHDKDVLGFLASVYADGDVWASWGNYINIDDEEENLEVFSTKYKPLKSSSYFAKPAPRNWRLREHWRYSHLKAAKYFLWKNIKDEDLRYSKTEKYYHEMDDYIIYPLLEMAGPKHSRFIKRILYVRTISNFIYRKNCLHKDAYAIQKEIRSKISYPEKSYQYLITHKEVRYL